MTITNYPHYAKAPRDRQLPIFKQFSVQNAIRSMLHANRLSERKERR